MVSHSHDPLHLAISVESSLVSISLTNECENNKVNHVFNMGRDKNNTTSLFDKSILQEIQYLLTSLQALLPQPPLMLLR